MIFAKLWFGFKDVHSESHFHALGLNIFLFAQSSTKGIGRRKIAVDALSLSTMPLSSEKIRMSQSERRKNQSVIFNIHGE